MVTWLAILLAVLLAAAVFVIRYLHREYRWLSRRYIDHLDDFSAAERPHWSMVNRGHLGDTRRSSLLLAANYRAERRAHERWKKAAAPFAFVVEPGQQRKKAVN